MSDAPRPGWSRMPGGFWQREGAVMWRQMTGRWVWSITRPGARQQGDAPIGADRDAAMDLVDAALANR